MARKSSKSGKPSVSARKANAIGFAKRRERKAGAALESDIYEFSAVKNKRENVTQSLDRDEAAGVNMEEGDVNTNVLRVPMLNMGEDGDSIDVEDDEEIMSDDAFDESDDERYAGFSFAKKPASAKSRRKTRGDSTAERLEEVDSNESDSPSGGSDEFLDVLDVLDGRGEPDPYDSEPQGKQAGSSESDEEDDDEDKEDEDEDDFAPSDAELHPDGEALDNLGTFVSQLPASTKRKARDTLGDDQESSDAPKKRRILKERTEPGMEGEFDVRGSSGSMLQLEDLLTPLVTKSFALDALRKSTKALVKGHALSAPLPQRTQDRLDREAAYEQTKEEVDKWKSTMKRIKEADHLSFPLQVPQKMNTSNSSLVSKFTPSNALESAVDKLLKAAHMREEGDIAKMEELKMNQLSTEEVAQRRAELRKMRELIFRAESKAKRIAKIKSKTYRKIRRKTRNRLEDLTKETEGAEEDDAEEQMTREVERARERATLRHKNTGKWARAMKGRGELEVDQRREIEEMLEKGEKLRAKIQGQGRSGDEEDSSDEDSGVDAVKARAFDELQKVEQDDDDLHQPAAKGVFAMKFMQDAIARDAQRVTSAVDDFRNEMARMEAEDGLETEGDDDETRPETTHVQRTGGRMIFRPSQVAEQPGPIVPSESSSTLKSSEAAFPPPAVASPTTRSSPSVLPVSPTSRAADGEPNPWLTSKASITAQSRKRNNVLVGKDSTGAIKSKDSMKKRLSKTDGERDKARDDAVVEISLDNVFQLPEEPSLSGTAAKTGSTKGKDREKGSQGAQGNATLESSDENSEIEAEEKRFKARGKGKRVKPLAQRDLVALAFAGDNVVQDFEKVKQQEVAADAPREEDLTLPGWGSWGGTGTKRNPHAKKFVKKIAGIDPKSRADHGKPHLIISEKKDKKAGKYLVKDLPHPYTSKAQFEKSMEIPIGSEWNTRIGFQRQTLPRVVKKLGTIIDPLEKIT